MRTCGDTILVAECLLFFSFLFLQGGTIRKLSADTGVRIHVPKAVARDRSEPKLGDGKLGKLDRLITLEGGPPSVFKCFQAVSRRCELPP